MRRRDYTFGCSVLLLLSLQLLAAAEDLKLSDGRKFRDARVLEVRPDALIVGHRDGIVLAEFEKLPKKIRARYGYNPREATAFRKREAETRRKDAEENQRLVAAYEQRKGEAIRAQMESGSSEGSTFAGFDESELTYRPGAAERAFDNAVTHISREIGRAEEARIAEKREPDTFWNPPFWKNPVVTFIGSLLGGGGGGNERGGGFSSEPRGWR